MVEDSETEPDDYVIYLEQENDVIKAVEHSDIEPADFIIGKAPPKTDHDILEKISIDLNDKELVQPSSLSNRLDQTLKIQEKDSYGVALGNLIKATPIEKIQEKDSYGVALGNIIKATSIEKNKYNQQKKEKYTFGLPLTVFDSFGEETFSNARFRIPDQFRKFLQQPPAWLNTDKW